MTTRFAEPPCSHPCETRRKSFSESARTFNTPSPVIRALRFIENRLERVFCLDDVAAACGVSRYQLSRVFVAATGLPVMDYVRGRRLSEAARLLAKGAPDILSVALNYGYRSHEAFTRAFCGLFGMTPESLRASGTLDGLRLTQALVTSDIRLVGLGPPRILYGDAVEIVGLRQQYVNDDNETIPLLWHRLARRMHELPNRAAPHTYGVLCQNDHKGNFGYVAGVAVQEVGRLPPGFVHAQLSARKYIVFHHHGHISWIRATMYSIWTHYLPNSGFRAIEAPEFERYTEAFNPRTGDGVVEIWIPIAGY